MIQLHESRRMKAVTPSHIPTVNALVREHPGTITLGQGVVHYGPPPEAREGVGRFFQDPKTTSTSPKSGLPALIDAFQAKLEAENGFGSGRTAASSSRRAATWGS